MQLIVEHIDPAKVSVLLAAHFNGDTSDALCMKACYSALLSPETCYVFFARYAALNGYAGPLVARLASSLGLSRGIFNDQAEYSDVSDKDMLIAQHVFAATVDEYGDNRQRGLTHRTLAQATVAAMARYAGLTRRRREQLGHLPVQYKPVLSAFIRDYQGEVGNARDLIRALGFHLASEQRADREYALIDEVFCHSSWGKEFKAWLADNKRIELAGESIPVWYWVATHGHYGGTGVEWAHFDEALGAIRLARRYSPIALDEFDRLIEEGYQAFIDLIDTAFITLTAECEALAETDTLVFA
ncbi:hypothetical protein [Shewanella sp.]|uniref:hypothetical protein n=1 Tax=Shewanella sp. TaxID=50422 RepID=UPI0035641A4B